MRTLLWEFPDTEAAFAKIVGLVADNSRSLYENFTCRYIHCFCVWLEQVSALDRGSLFIRCDDGNKSVKRTNESYFICKIIYVFV